jgi:hypothetical protein
MWENKPEDEKVELKPLMKALENDLPPISLDWAIILYNKHDGLKRQEGVLYVDSSKTLRVIEDVVEQGDFPDFYREYLKHYVACQRGTPVHPSAIEEGMRRVMEAGPRFPDAKPEYEGASTSIIEISDLDMTGMRVESVGAQEQGRVVLSQEEVDAILEEENGNGAEAHDERYVPKRNRYHQSRPPQENPGELSQDEIDALLAQVQEERANGNEPGEDFWAKLNRDATGEPHECDSEKFIESAREITHLDAGLAYAATFRPLTRTEYNALVDSTLEANSFTPGASNASHLFKMGAHLFSPDGFVFNKDGTVSKAKARLCLSNFSNGFWEYCGRENPYLLNSDTYITRFGRNARFEYVKDLDRTIIEYITTIHNKRKQEST